MALKLLIIVSLFLASTHAQSSLDGTCTPWTTFGTGGSTSIADFVPLTDLTGVPNEWGTDCEVLSVNVMTGSAPEGILFYNNQLEPHQCHVEETLPSGGDFVRVRYGATSQFSTGSTLVEVGNTFVESTSNVDETTDAPYNDGDIIKLTEVNHVGSIIYSIEICNYFQPNAGACFHGDGTVMLESGSSKRLSELSLGDRIKTCDGRGRFSFNPVLILPHANNTEPAMFLTLTTETGKMVDMTPDHFVPRCDNKEVTAGELYVGDCLFTVDGKETLIDISEKEKNGVFTAVTQDNFIVVDGVIASPYSKVFDPRKKTL